ncbi:hypothetical protein QBC43DRAFT_211297 [Cladorrhinum sp. PSN259]|nr:hypothetical protein QBC43DRAFT_211297 [Cladorrhinum sp. PSN259]
MCYTHLFLRVESFARKYFDLGDMDTDSYHGEYVWLEDLPKEFLWYAKKVARQDNFNGQWDTLLTLSTFRRCLVIAIFAKVLETFIWDELLFGGRKDQFLMLSSQDQSLLGLDGYKRTDLRTRTVRATLRNKTLTPYFWASVDDLSVRITAMFMPLVQVLDKHFPESNTTSIRTMHQDIHAIVAEAGYFSIGVAWSHDIFRFSSPFLGQSWDLDQAHYDDGPWDISKQLARRKADLRDAEQALEDEKRNLARAADDEARTRATRTISKLKDQVKERKQELGRAEKIAAARLRDTSMDAIVWPEPPTSTSRLAKVQLVLWPMLQRYSPLGPLDPETKVSREGETIVRLAKSQVIYYAGMSDSTREQEESIPTLDTWIKKKRLSRNWAWFKPLLWLATFFLTLLLVHLATQRIFPWLDRFLNWLERLFWNLGQGIILCSAALVLNGISFLLQLIVTIAKLSFWFIYALRNLLARLVGAQLSGPASGLQFSPGATTMSFGGKPWEAAGLQYPELSWDSISNLARVIYGELVFVWKRKALNIEIPYPSIRRAAPVWGFEVPVPA